MMIAGGVGINPLMSIISSFVVSRTWPSSVTLLYGTKTAEHEDLSDILFFNRLIKAVENSFAADHDKSRHLDLEMFVTSPRPNSIKSSGTHLSSQVELASEPLFRRWARRMTIDDIRRKMGVDVASKSLSASEEMTPKTDISNTVFYVCGPQAMTDEFVDEIKQIPRVIPENVLCEKWW